MSRSVPVGPPLLLQAPGAPRPAPSALGRGDGEGWRRCQSRAPDPGTSGLPPGLSPGRQHSLAQSITEAKPPEVPARPRLTLPPDIDRFPFSSFISIGFQVGPPGRSPPWRVPQVPDVSPYQAAAGWLFLSPPGLLPPSLGLWTQLPCSEKTHRASVTHSPVLFTLRSHAWYTRAGPAAAGVC